MTRIRPLNTLPCLIITQAFEILEMVDSQKKGLIRKLGAADAVFKPSSDPADVAH